MIYFAHNTGISHIHTSDDKSFVTVGIFVAIAILLTGLLLMRGKPAEPSAEREDDRS
jgi:hypothetical protein